MTGDDIRVRRPSRIHCADDSHSIANRMAGEEVHGVPAHMYADSQQNGWEPLRKRLKNVLKPEELRLFVFSACCQFTRTVPTLPRSQRNTDAEDYIGDAAHYRVMKPKPISRWSPFQGDGQQRGDQPHVPASARWVSARS